MIVISSTYPPFNSEALTAWSKSLSAAPTASEFSQYFFTISTT